MFAKATRKFVREIDPDGCLIPVSRLNDSDKLLLLSIVVKSKPIWFWKPPKYKPSDFTLSDVLLGDKEIKPDAQETEFLKYEGMYGDIKMGKLDTEVSPVNLNLEGETSSMLQSSFGTLKKQEVDVQKLLEESRDSFMNLEHCLIKQMREQQKEAFGVLKERIFTTEQCTIYEQVQEQGDCATALGFRKHKIQVSVKNEGTRFMDSKVSLEIPPQTVLAYSIIELEVKAHGKFDLCLLPQVQGGFEVDSSGGARVVAEGPTAKELKDPQSLEGETLQVLLKDLKGLNVHFQQLAAIPARTRRRLFDFLKEMVLDRAAVNWLGDMLDRHHRGEAIGWGQLEEGFPLNRMAQSVLDLLKGEGETAGEEPGSSPLLAVHMLVSAVEEMTDAALAALGDCCTPSVLQVLQHLVQSFEEGEEEHVKDEGLSTLLGDGAFQSAARLCRHCGVNLRREGGAVRGDVGQNPGFGPLVLCIVVRGLACLSAP
ncbi:gasdermin Eb isoform X1 [Brienomyrus brachyistius]|uniref:gasdermin Eb isoform X1 n=1 Tax=Brienomyrus brachyistius TaxID=42636 RepID=UPI0020B40122|nr:gasdermin Eb isoform X1 [Brienomyrus brachyistius]